MSLANSIEIRYNQIAVVSTEEKIKLNAVGFIHFSFGLFIEQIIRVQVLNTTLLNTTHGL